MRKRSGWAHSAGSMILAHLLLLLLLADLPGVHAVGRFGSRSRHRSRAELAGVDLVSVRILPSSVDRILAVAILSGVNALLWDLRRGVSGRWWRQRHGRRRRSLRRSAHSAHSVLRRRGGALPTGRGALHVELNLVGGPRGCRAEKEMVTE